MRRKTIEDCHAFANKLNITCTSKFYNNAKGILKWKCHCGYEWERCYDTMKRSPSCPKCINKLPASIERANEFAKIRNGKCLSKSVKGNGDDLLWSCYHGHIFKARYYNVQTGNSWCSDCNSFAGEKITRLIFEKMFDEKFQKIKVDWMRSPDTNAKLELDGYCDKLNIAFEYNGEQHYKDSYYNRSKYDELKIIKCKENGVNLFIFPELKNHSKYQKIIESIKIQSNNFGIHIPNPDALIDLNELTMNTDGYKYMQNLQEIAHGHGGRLLDKTYVSANYKYSFICKNNHTSLMCGITVSKGSWCLKCENDKRKNNPFSSSNIEHYKIIQKIVKNHGGIIITPIYLNDSFKMTVECKNNHRFLATANTIKKMHWCKICSLKARVGEKRSKYRLRKNDKISNK